MKKAIATLGYFRHPFPSQEGFSAYRMPGLAVHGPLLFAAALVGFALCWPHPILRPLLIVWLLAGLYLGRDIAIFCHYAPLLTLVCWVVAGLVIVRPQYIAKFGAMHGVVSAILSLALLGVLIARVYVVYKQYRDTDVPEADSANAK